jgi:3-hydroxybutyryl-CoA dehydrogenase
MNVPQVAVVGLGFLGRGIAANLLAHGFQVVGQTRSSSSHEHALRAIEQAVEEMIGQGGFPVTLREQWRSRYRASSDVGDLADCSFVIESVAEDEAVKNAVFDALEETVGPDVPIASNTSALPISWLQRSRRRPGRFLGMHFAEPAYATRFLELIRGDQTDDAAFEAAVQFAVELGKEPSIVQKDVPGFIVNRLAYAVYREALSLIEQGVADAETIDRSFRNAAGLWATFCGPLRWIDLTGGPALYERAMRPVLPTLSDASEPPEQIRHLAEQGAEGISNRRGFYEYTEDEAERWEQLFHQHAWRVWQMVNEYRPLEQRS